MKKENYLSIEPLSFYNINTNNKFNRIKTNKITVG